jgi:hypothetical protein
MCDKCRGDHLLGAFLSHPIGHEVQRLTRIGNLVHDRHDPALHVGCRIDDPLRMLKLHFVFHAAADPRG